MRNCFPKILGPFFQLENRSADADMVSQFQILFCKFYRVMEAVDHTAQLSSRVPFEYPERILMGIANMEDYRQIQLVYEPDVLLQPVLFFALIVIVQTDFTDRDHTRRLRIKLLANFRFSGLRVRNISATFRHCLLS